MPNQFIKMRNVAVVLLSAFFLSCEDPQDISFDLSTGENLRTFFTDTFSVARSTVLLDSAVTSKQSQLLVGGHIDPLFGYIKSNAYFHLSLPASPLTGLDDPLVIDNTAIYDSLKILLFSSSYYLGDSTNKVSISLHRLTSPLSTVKNYNYDDEIPFDPTPILTKVFNLEDLVNTSRDTLTGLQFKLPDAIGKELFDLRNNDMSKTTLALSQAFKGFVIRVNNKPLGHYGFRVGQITSSATSSVNLYYHLPNETTAARSQFEINSSRFNQVISDRSGTIIKNLTKKRVEVLSKETIGLTFVQSSTGISSKITIPELNKIPKGSLINSAFITLEIDSTTINKGFPAINNIVLAELDANNVIRKNASNYPILVNSGLGVEGFAGVYNPTNHTYIVNVTTYLQNAVNGLRPNTSGLAVLPASLTTNGTGITTNSSFTRVVLRNAKLTMYYSVK